MKTCKNVKMRGVVRRMTSLEVLIHILFDIYTERESMF